MTIRYLAALLYFALCNTCLLIAQMSVALAPSKDNTIYLSPQGDPLSNGAGNRIFAGRSGDGTLQRALMHFDVAGNIPANARIESAVLTLRRVMIAPSGDGRNLSLHRLEKDWGEGGSMADMGQGMGGNPSDGDATWAHTFFNTDFWETEGGDFASPASAAAETSSGSDELSFGSPSEMVADVQVWLDDPAGNFGWIVVGDESANGTANGFASREGAEADRPRLIIEYSMSTSRQNPFSDRLELDVFPNPSRDRFSFEFALDEKATVRLVICDLLGKPVRTLPAQTYPSGTNRLQWDGRDKSGNIIDAGFYLYVLTIGNEQTGGKILRLR